MSKPKIGLLALYLKLYDDTQGWLRADIEAFQSQVETTLGRDMEVVHYPVCRLGDEIQAALAAFEAAGVDAVVTLHLAYSPSLEACGPLGKTTLPILVLDTTPDYAFDAQGGAGRVMQNHGIHGVQDLCSVLRRIQVPYQVFAGHLEHSDVAARLHRAAVGAMMSRRMRNSRIGRVGDSFTGMGDFFVEEEALQALGITTVPFHFESGRCRLNEVDADAIDTEWKADSARFQVEALGGEAYRASAQVGLALRRWVEEEKLDGLTVNFLATDHNPALPVMPFLEMCKCMERGTGYAGEGDVLNAAFVAALMRGFPKTTFSEMFCPNWRDGSVFCSHMGEFNPAVADTPLLLTEMDFSYTSAGNPAALYGCLAGHGNAGFVNLNPLAGGRYVLIAAPGSMLSVPEAPAEMKHTVRGWFAPQVPLAHFLERYSRLGGGHHGAILYEFDPAALASFAHCMGWDFELIT